jgi:hypothetical protein
VDLAFLQRPVEVGQLFGPRARDMRLGEEVLLDSIGSDVTGVTFHARLFKGVLKGCQSIIPHGDGTSLLSSSLSREGAAPAAQWPLHVKETEPNTNQKIETSITPKKQAQASVGRG